MDARIIQLPKILDARGNLSFAEGLNHIPFEIRRTYWLYDVPGGEGRGGHAYRKNEEFVVALSGSFDVVLDDGRQKRTYSLNRPYNGLLVKPGIWRDLDDFSSGAVCLVLASEVYQASDYIRDYGEFLRFRGL